MADLGKRTVPKRAALFGSERNGGLDLVGSRNDLFWPRHGKGSLVEWTAPLVPLLERDGDAMLMKDALFLPEKERTYRTLT